MHDLKQLILDLSELYRPKISGRAAELIVRRMEEYAMDDCYTAISRCEIDADVGWPNIKRHLIELRQARAEKNKSAEAEADEAFLAEMDRFGEAGTPPSCPERERRCNVCAASAYCPLPHYRTKAAIKAVLEGKITAEKANRRLAKEFPGLGFEEPGTAEYRRYFGDGCKVCSGRLEKTDYWSCIVCGQRH